MEAIARSLDRERLVQVINLESSQVAVYSQVRCTLRRQDRGLGFRVGRGIALGKHYTIYLIMSHNSCRACLRCAGDWRRIHDGSGICYTNEVEHKRVH